MSLNYTIRREKERERQRGKLIGNIKFNVRHHNELVSCLLEKDNECQ